MAPCPTTIATFGFLLLARPPVRRLLLAIPLLWAVLAPPAAVSRGVWEDTGLVVFGLAAAIILLRRRQPPALTKALPADNDRHNPRADDHAWTTLPRR
jgi:hypothetical protein